MSQRPDISRAAVFVGQGKPLELRELPVPAPAAYEALVRIECCTICGSDLHTVSGKRTEATPTILGHEAVGTVCELG
ncbi:MAG TPA: alcohol dehydrogenase catalytic domain-containing protein, partial [Planctomycetaceae bacterium]|nr:alcohol dehydrogenase catalytic domain-containing protein [Planctomycetaceae bacterium]